MQLRKFQMPGTCVVYRMSEAHARPCFDLPKEHVCACVRVCQAACCHYLHRSFCCTN